jgi:hypothetical protein
MKIKFNIKVEEVKSSYQEQIDKLTKELSDVKRHYEEIIRNSKKLLNDGNISKQREIDDLKKYYEDYIKTLTNQFEDQLGKIKAELESKMNTSIEELKKMHHKQLLDRHREEDEKV